MKILPNGVAVIEGDTHHAQWCATAGLVHDRWMADILRHHIIRRQFRHGSVVVEGGANIGTLTLPMLEAGATVWAFEPNEDAHSCLIHNCARHLGQLHAGACGLSDSFYLARLKKESNAGASWICGGGDGEAAVVDHIDNYGLSPSLIKLDIEGYEVKALNGALDTIARCSPVLIVEVNRAALERAGDSEDALLSLIESLGYRWSILQPQCKRGDDQYDIECIPNA